MAQFKINNVAMTNMPAHVQVIYPEPVVYPGPGLGKVVVQPRTPPTIEVRWGMSAMARAVIAELISKRGQKLVHMVSWTNEVGGRLMHATVVIPPIGYGQGPSQQYADPLTVRMEQITPMPHVVPIDLFVSSTFTAGDGKAKYQCKAGGQILAIGGFIGTLGSGGGTSTDIQVSNGTVDYLSTLGTFEVDSATGLMENAVLGANVTFQRGDTIELDIDAISTDPANLQITLYTLMYAV